MPTRALVGSNIVDYNDNLTKTECPFTDTSLTAVRAVQPDVGILHCQRADTEGNAQKWGTLCVDVEGIGASKKVIVTAEEIVDSEVIRREPNLTIVPSFRVSAVVHQPWGAYPWSIGGCYNRDMTGFMAAFRSSDTLEAYLKDFVHGVANWEEYLSEISRRKGEDYFENLRIKHRVLSDSIITGY
jgi:glutaconate CoA-transferase subunit A